MVLTSGPVRLRPISSHDRRDWRAVRQRNHAWLARWEATAPPGARLGPRTFGSMVRDMRRQARAGRQMPFVVELEGRFVGQVTVNNIVRGSGQFASVGYWVDEAVAGRGVISRAVALAVDHCFAASGLHRVEVAIRPENTASLRVVEKLGVPQVGYAPRFLHIDGEWRDHVLFAVTAEDVPGGLVARLDDLEARRRSDSHQSQE